MEKETLGLFLSSHPLKEVRAALRAKVDCSLPELEDKKDGEWVTVGGMVAEVKKIRTRKGDPMMFCTLDDLEGQVEMIVFNSALEKHEGKLDGDRVVLVRARVDKKESNEVKLVAQDVEVFEPTPEEVEKAAAEAAVAAVPQAPDPARGARACPTRSSRSCARWSSTCPRRAGADSSAVGERSLLLGPDFRVSRRRRVPQPAGPTGGDRSRSGLSFLVPWKASDAGDRRRLWSSRSSLCSSPGRDRHGSAADQRPLDQEQLGHRARHPQQLARQRRRQERLAAAARLPPRPAARRRAGPRRAATGRTASACCATSRETSPWPPTPRRRRAPRPARPGTYPTGRRRLPDQRRRARSSTTR